MSLYLWFLNLLMNKHIAMSIYVIPIILFFVSSLFRKRILAIKDSFALLESHEANDFIYVMWKLLNIVRQVLVYFFILLTIYFLFVIVFGLIANQYPDEFNMKPISYYQSCQPTYTTKYFGCYNRFIRKNMNSTNEHLFYEFLKREFSNIENT